MDVHDCEMTQLLNLGAECCPNDSTEAVANYTALSAWGVMIFMLCRAVVVLQGLWSILPAVQHTSMLVYQCPVHRRCRNPARCQGRFRSSPLPTFILRVAHPQQLGYEYRQCRSSPLSGPYEVSKGRHRGVQNLCSGTS